MGSGVVWVRGEQRAPENATNTKTPVIDSSENPGLRVYRVFGCSLFSSRKRNRPEIGDVGYGPFSAFSGALRFWVCFRACLSLSVPSISVSVFVSVCPCAGGKKNRQNMNMLGGLFWDWTESESCLYVVWGVISYAEEKHMNGIHPASPATILGLTFVMFRNQEKGL